MLTKIKNKAKKLAKGKKGVSQFVEMLIIMGVTLAVGGIVVGIVWGVVNKNKDTGTPKDYSDPTFTNP